MRPPLLPILLSLIGGTLCLLPAAALAQQQEKGLMDRLDAEARDAQNAMNGGGKAKAYADQNHDFSGSKDFGAKTASLKEFYSPQKFHAKDFLTGDYHGSKDYWMGDFKYSTQVASLAAKEDPNAKKQYATASSPVKEAADSKKGYPVSEAETKKYTARSKLDKFDPQNAIPSGEGWQGNLETMSIDQVRALLNKNK